MNKLIIFISKDAFPVINPKGLFILVRPFYADSGWLNNDQVKSVWGIGSDVEYVDNPNAANLLLIANPINEYVKEKKVEVLQSINTICINNNIQGYGFISGDFGKAYPEFSNLTYFRMGGFKSQLSNRNIGFPVTISDYFRINYREEFLEPFAKKEKPIIGFCGHATPSLFKRLIELGKNIFENVKRFKSNPFRKDWEPLFASAYERWKLLQILEKSSDLQCNFIYRNKYRAGAKTKEVRELTTEEYYENLLESDYVLCVRGAGNFSVRFYETLMVGKIPIFVNTDCLLPLADEVDWKQHVVWVEWKERHLIALKVSEFHKKISNEDFLEIQRKNRKLWKEQLTVKNYLNKISKK